MKVLCERCYGNKTSIQLNPCSPVEPHTPLYTHTKFNSSRTSRKCIIDIWENREVRYGRRRETSLSAAPHGGFLSGLLWGENVVVEECERTSLVYCASIRPDWSLLQHTEFQLKCWLLLLDEQWSEMPRGILGLEHWQPANESVPLEWKTEPDFAWGRGKNRVILPLSGDRYYNFGPNSRKAVARRLWKKLKALPLH